MPEFQHLLAQVFERRGYSVAFGSALTGKTGTSYQVPLLARSGGLSLAVHWKTDAPLTAQEAAAFSGALDDLGLSGGVLVAWGGADAAAAQTAPGKIEVWNTARVAAEVGDAIIHAALAPA
ncbi:MAG TPA: restriction endonuclease, partial [Candidatus Thermoplasmatota archaeon]|nr:restriction endonuclease [Candidatus Thermoplasmatota archaeon]